MSKESDFATRMEADATLLAILTGEVFEKGEIGQEGITRDTAPGAYDAGGWLKPCALVHQRGRVPDGQIRDGITQVASTTQAVEIYLYQRNAYDQIDAAFDRIYALFQGHLFDDSFEVYLSNVLDRERDSGPQKGARMARLVFTVHSILEAA